jgi:hypothetical protein
MAEAADKISRTITIVAALLGVVVTANTLLTSCENRQAERYKSFRTAVQSEEDYWKGLYSDYQSVFTDAALRNQQDARRARLLSLHTMAQRPAATFREYSVSENEKQSAMDRIGSIRTSLLNALPDADPALAAELRRRRFLTRVSERPEASEAPGESAPAMQPQVTPAPTQPTQQIVQLSPPSDSGWDLDIFWCPGQHQSSNYATATSMGNAFASFATTQATIAPGVTLGRVRVRPAPLSLQVPGGPARGFSVVHDSGPGEFEAADAVRATMSNSLAPGGQQVRLLRSVGNPTRWYVSAFVCTETAAARPGV